MTPRTLIFTGEGKGKTTAALGMVVRAVGHGQDALVIQFLKSRDSTGEARLLGRSPAALPGVEWHTLGCGFVPAVDDPNYPGHVAAARAAYSLALDEVRAGRHDLIVLDEICGAAAKGLLTVEDGLTLIHTPGRRGHLVLTGRNAPEAWIAAADTVTEMRCLKHGYSEGFPATKGVEL
jgi:cob(I)alamin adenosyltransferase